MKAELAQFQFENGMLSLTEAGTQRRASLHLVVGEAGLVALDPGGVEVFDIDLDRFTKVLQAENHTLKRALTELWQTDGTPAGTTLVADSNPGINDGAGGQPMVTFRGRTYFLGRGATTGFELWATDGTAAGTVMIKDVNPGPGDGSAGFLTIGP